MYRVDRDSDDVPSVLWDLSMRKWEGLSPNELWLRPPLGVADDGEPGVELVSNRRYVPVPGAPAAGAHLLGPPTQTGKPSARRNGGQSTGHHPCEVR